MEILLKSVFVLTFLVLMVQLHRGLLAFFGQRYNWPYLGKNIYIIYPSILFQIYFWSNYFGIFN